MGVQFDIGSTPEEVIRPSYYRARHGTGLIDSSADVIDVIDAFELPYCLGLALKHMVRAGRKQGEAAETDYDKAIELLRRQRRISNERAWSNATPRGDGGGIDE